MDKIKMTTPLVEMDGDFENSKKRLYKQYQAKHGKTWLGKPH